MIVTDLEEVQGEVAGFVHLSDLFEEGDGIVYVLQLVHHLVQVVKHVRRRRLKRHTVQHLSLRLEVLEAGVEVLVLRVCLKQPAGQTDRT